MLTFDARLTLSLTTKGDRPMSDEWINTIVARMNQHHEETARAEKYALLREQQIGIHEFTLFQELQETVKSAVAKINQRVPGKQLSVGSTPYDRLEVNTASPNLSLTVRYQSDRQMVSYMLYKPSGDEEGEVKLDLTKGELHYVLNGKPLTSRRLAEELLDRLVNALVEKQ